MYTVGREIENAIQSMISVSEAFAKMQAKLDETNNDLGMLETLFDVSKYIGSDIEPHMVMNVLEDSVKGVFGVSYSQVVFDEKWRHLSNSNDLYEHFDFETLDDNVEDILVVDDLSKSEMTALSDGSAILIRLGIGKDTYGFLVCYWARSCEINKSKIIFLQIISTQVSVYLKSACLVEEFKEMAVLDPLTGIYNRSYFSNIEATSMPALGESIIMFDIDHFKQVNDTKGHPYGDKILIGFANILTDVSKKNDGVAFKYGGEEFIIRAYGGKDHAHKIAYEACSRFKEETGYTVSAGISTVGDSCKVATYTNLVALADEALYVSKQCGRDRITHSTSDIQLLKKASKSLSSLLSKSFRQHTPMGLVRLDMRNHAAFTEEEFEDLHATVTGISRIYDEVFLTASLDVLYIIHGKVDVDEFMHRAKVVLKEKHPNLEYDIHSLDGVFNEVIVHSSRVSELSQILGAELGFSSDVLTQIRMACEWHDVGKICTDPRVYNKEEPLSEVEYEVIKMHSWLSYCIANDHPSMAAFSSWVLYHHEDYNGRGYYGLKGSDIPFPAQVISLVDKFDALTENRCYRPAYGWKEAMRILREESVKFDDSLFGVFEKLVNQMMMTGPVEHVQ